MEPLKIPLVRSPVFVLGDNASDYASMGSEEFDSDDIHHNNDDKHQFKSAFAQELNEKVSRNFVAENPNANLSNSQLDVILDKTLDFKRAQEDFLRVKQENARLRFEIEKHKYEEERYNKFQLEIEHLTCKLNKVGTSIAKNIWQVDYNQVLIFRALIYSDGADSAHVRRRLQPIRIYF